MLLDRTGAQLIGDAVEVEAGAAHQDLDALFHQGLEVLGDLLVPGGELDARIHKEDRAGQIVRLSQSIEEHPHQIGAQLPVAGADDIPAHKDGIARAGGDSRAICRRRGGRGRAVFHKGQAVYTVRLGDGGIIALVARQALEIANGGGVVHQNGCNPRLSGETASMAIMTGMGQAFPLASMMRDI